MTSITTVNGAALRHRFDGPADGDVVMLSNSLASNLHMWDAQMEALTGAGYRVLRYDSRGMGGSEVTAGPYTIAQLAADALGLMDALGLGRVHFCGLSKGGMVGQHLGTHHGDRLISLTLCDTAAHMAPASMWEERCALVRDGGMAAVAEGTLSRWFTAAGRERLADEFEAIREMILTTPPAGFIACCQAIAAMDQRADIAAITTPTCVIVGEDDPSTPVAASELIHAAIPGASLVVLAQAAHLSNIEQREAFNASLLKFLSSAR